LDSFVETVLVPEYTRGAGKAANPAYQKIKDAIRRARSRGDHAAVRELRKRLRRRPSRDPRDPGYRRLRYVRYADDQLLGFVGPKAEAEQIKACLAGRCELCASVGEVEVHHVGKLAHLATSGQPPPQWAQVMTRKRRKTLVVCAACHETAHTRQPSATPAA
jgi:hypothetical protein